MRGRSPAAIDHRSNAERGIEVVESNERVRGLNAAILAARSALDALS